MTSNHSSDVLSVDGPRPAVAAISVLPRSYRLTDAERLVLFALACDSYEGESSAPGYDALCKWTGLHKGRVVKAISDLCAAHPHRPALLVKDSVRGRKRTRYYFVLEPVVSANQSASPTGVAREPVEQLDRSESPTDADREPVAEPVAEPVVEPVGQPDLLPSLSLPSIPPTPRADQLDAQRVEHRGEEDGEATGSVRKQKADVETRRDAHRRDALDPDDPRTDINSGYWVWLNERRDNPHPYEYNARLRIARIHERRSLPLDPEELLTAAYRLGNGNPWEGARVVDRQTEGSLATARDAARVVRANLRNASRA